MARALNVSVELVQAWEAGRRTPQGAALRLLELVGRFPELLAPDGASAVPMEPPTEVPLPARQAAGAPPRRQMASPVRTAAVVPMMSTPFDALVAGLIDHRVRFVVVGSVADHCHGATGGMDDLDICFDRSAENLAYLAAHLRELKATLRGAPGAPPFAGDSRTLAHSTALAFDTRFGPLDIRHRITGVGDHGDCVPRSVPRRLGGRQVLVLDLPALIMARRAAGRPRDRQRLAELERLAAHRS